MSDEDCRVFWGSHGCKLERGHDGPHECACCECEDHPDPGSGCVGKASFYGPDTYFYGEDITLEEVAAGPVPEAGKR